MTMISPSTPRHGPRQGLLGGHDPLRRAVGRLICGFSLLLSANVAAIEPSEFDKQTARELVFAGDRAFREGDFAQALARYSTAYRLVQVPSVGIEVARAQVALGQLRDAYRSALGVVDLPKSAEVKPVLVQARRDAVALARDLRERIPTLQVSITPPLVAARVELDGTVTATDQSSGQQLDPGKHRVRVSATGFRTVELEVALAEREKRVLTVQLEPAQPSVPSVAAAPKPLPAAPLPSVAVSPKSLPSSTPPSAYETPASRALPMKTPPVAYGTASRTAAESAPRALDAGAPADGKTVAYALLGVGALGATVGGIAGIVAYAKVPSCPQDRCPRTLEDDLATSKQAGDIANVAFAAGALSAAVGFVVLLAQGQEAEAESVAVRAAGDARSVQLELSGSF